MYPGLPLGRRRRRRNNNSTAVSSRNRPPVHYLSIDHRRRPDDVTVSPTTGQPFLQRQATNPKVAAIFFADAEGRTRVVRTHVDISDGDKVDKEEAAP